MFKAKEWRHLCRRLFSSRGPWGLGGTHNEATMKLDPHEDVWRRKVKLRRNYMALDYSKSTKN